MILTNYKKHKVARMLFVSPDTRLEIVASSRPLNLTYKLTLVYNNAHEVCFYSENLKDLLPPGQYPFNVFTAWYVNAPYDVKVIAQGSLSFQDYKDGVSTSPLIALITYQN